MYIRKLKQKDAPFMLEWMHDKTVVENMQANFLSKTLTDCEDFIRNAQNAEEDLHMAIVDEEDTYMGTVSLKHIKGDYAEFGITIRSGAMGKGYSKFAMEEIIRIGYEELGLNHIYWCLSKKNERATRFYDKNGYKRIDVAPDVVDKTAYTKEQIESYLWYQTDRKEK